MTLLAQQLGRPIYRLYKSDYDQQLIVNIELIKRKR